MPPATLAEGMKKRVHDLDSCIGTCTLNKPRTKHHTPGASYRWGQATRKENRQATTGGGGGGGGGGRGGGGGGEKRTSNTSYEYTTPC